MFLTETSQPAAACRSNDLHAALAALRREFPHSATGDLTAVLAAARRSMHSAATPTSLLDCARALMTGTPARAR